MNTPNSEKATTPKKKWQRWIKRYLLFGGIALIGVPIWEYFLEEWIFSEVDLFFPGGNDVIIGVIHIGIFVLLHLLTKKLERIR